MENGQLYNQNQDFHPASPPPLPPLTFKQTRVHIFLFIISIFATMMVGAANLGYPWDSMADDFMIIFQGWEYSFAVLFILTCHEMGHYLAARWHRLNVSLPFYIPLPIPYLFHFGTMGAFIRIKSPIPNRIALMDVAVAGPLAGFVATLICLVYGYATLPDAETVNAYIETVHMRAGILPDMDLNFTLTMGNSLLFYFFNEIIGGGYVPMSEIYHFPFIFAGWIGFFITALNLIPIGQLDGGHIVYALFGQKARQINYAAYGALGLLTIYLIMTLGVIGSFWILWMVILKFIGLRHPPTLYDAIRIPAERSKLGWACIAIFVLCFIPLPIYIA